MNIIEYFDRTRIINLAARNDRREETELEFKRFGFPINTDKVSFFKAISPDEPAGFPNTGARGCFLSHMEIIREAKESELNNLLILEDDILFSKKVLEYGSIAVEKLTSLDWDIVYFGHTLESDSDFVGWKRLDRPMLKTHCYAINESIFDELTRFLQKVLQRPPGHRDGGPMHYDGALNTFRKQNPSIKSYYYSKNLGYQRPSVTDVHSLSFLDEKALFKSGMTLFRQLKRFFFRVYY